MHHSIKRALDPHNILNPGKVIPNRRIAMGRLRD
jgi:FAD/FMN-containing dehydrogenase